MRIELKALDGARIVVESQRTEEPWRAVISISRDPWSRGQTAKLDNELAADLIQALFEVFVDGA